MFKVNNKDTIKSGVFIVNFENISHLVLVFLLLTLNMLLLSGGLYLEAVSRTCSVKKAFLEISQN